MVDAAVTPTEITLPLERIADEVARAIGEPFVIESVSRLGSGASNEMYVLDSGARQLILRTPPPVKTSKTAHDVVRETTILRALDRTDVPHPRVVLLNEDESILGRPFMVIEKVVGFHLDLETEPPYAVGPLQRHALGLSFIDNLARIGAVDWEDAGLDGFGRPDGFLQRQVERWLGQLAEYRSRELPYLDHITSWLRANRPTDASPGILHGDYQFLNVLFAPAEPADVVAIVDWEQSTIGDPLVDLGWVLGLWSEPGERSAVTGERWITQQEGMPTRRELTERYATVSGRDVSDIAYYEVLALFKLACILEGSFAKASRGESDIERQHAFGPMVLRLLEDAAAISRGERS